MSKLSKRTDRYGRTDRPNLIIGNLRFIKLNTNVEDILGATVPDTLALLSDGSVGDPEGAQGVGVLHLEVLPKPHHGKRAS